MDRTHQRVLGRFRTLCVCCSTGILGLLALLPAQTTAQAVLGELVDSESGQPVATAQVVLANSLGNVVGRALSDSDGRFFIAIDLGIYSLVVNRLSYEPEHVTDIEITNSSVMAIKIRLSPDAVELPGLLVQGERREPSLQANGFYDRKKRGFGHFVEVEPRRRLQALRPSELVRRLPGVVTRNGEVRSTRGAFRPDGPENCLLQIVVDGVYRGGNLDDILTVEEIAALEVYTGASNVPPRWQGLAGIGFLNITGGTTPTCGVVAVWTKR